MRNYKTKIGVLLLLTMLVVISGCTIKKPEAPTWETTWDMPLTNRTYSIEELIDEMNTEDIVFDSEGNPNFSFTQQVDSVAVENNLTADAVDHTYEDSLDVVDIDAPVIDPENFTFAGLQIPNVANTVPDDTLFNKSQPLSTINTFSWAEIYQGTLQIEVANDLGVDVDSLIIWIYNASDTLTPVGIAVFENGIDDNETLNRQVPLDGETIEFELVVRTFGTVLAQAISLPTNDLVISATFPSGLSVTAAQAEIPAFSKNLDQTIELTDSSIIYAAVIDQGNLVINMVNGSNLPMNLTMTIPSFELAGSPLSFNENVAGNSSVIRNIDLNNYSFYPTGTSSPQTIAVDVVANIDDTAPTRYDVHASDSLRVISHVSEIVFQSVTGRIEPTEIDIDPMSEDVDVPDGFEDAHLTQAEMRLRLYNNSTADVYVDMLLENEDHSKSVVVQDTVRGKSLSASQPRETEIVVTALELSTFLDPTPNVINITGTAIMNPANADSITINSDDFFYGEIEIYSPLAFALDDTSEIDLDITDADLSDEDKPDIQETFDYGYVHAELGSHLPVGMYVSLYIGTRNDSTIFDDPASVVVGPFIMESAPVDANGFATEEIAVVFDDTLTSSEFAIFDNDQVYIAPRVALLPTTAAGSWIQGSDYITISAMAQVRVNAGEHLWDNGN